MKNKSATKLAKLIIGELQLWKFDKNLPDFIFICYCHSFSSWDEFIGYNLAHHILLKIMQSKSIEKRM